MKDRHPFWITFGLLAVMLGLSIAIGPTFIAPSVILRILLNRLPGITLTPDWAETAAVIVLQVRLPRTLLMALTGAALGGSGAAYQGVFRNPLADPYLIGVASGAGLGAIMAMAVRWPAGLLGFYATPAAAFLGALLTVALVLSLARTGSSLPPTTMVLAGVAVSSFATSLTSFLMLRATNELHRALGWLLGGAVMSGWNPVLAMLPYVAIGLGGLLTTGHALNVLQFGDEQAQQLGLAAGRARLIVILCASLATAAAVAFCGIIGFLGLIVPHLIRLIWGTDYRRLIPLSILNGSTGLLAADLLARTLLAPQVLPVGIITALAGAPFFLWVLRRARSQVAI